MDFLYVALAYSTYPEISRSEQNALPVPFPSSLPLEVIFLSSTFSLPPGERALLSLPSMALQGCPATLPLWADSHDTESKGALRLFPSCGPSLRGASRELQTLS